MPIDDLLTTSEASERLKRPPRTIARWAHSGRLPIAHRLPGETGAMLFDRADVERIADELAAAAPAPSGAAAGDGAA